LIILLLALLLAAVVGEAKDMIIAWVITGLAVEFGCSTTIDTGISILTFCKKKQNITQYTNVNKTE
jgi:hypothetical protein